MKLWGKCGSAALSVAAAVAFCACESRSLGWRYTVKPAKGDTVLSMGPVTIVFQNRKCTGTSKGNFLAYYYDSPFETPSCKIMGRTDKSGGGPLPSVTQEGGYAHIRFLGHRIRVMSRGDRLSVDGKVFSLAGPKTTIVVPLSGDAHLKGS